MLKPLLDIERDHYAGWRFAPVELVAYGDFQCRLCGEVYPVIKMLQQQMGDDLKYAYRHYPLPGASSLSLEAAVASELAALQDKFWYMHDILFENQENLSRPSLLRFAEEIEMDISAFIDKGEFKKLKQKVSSDYESGIRNGVTDTPAFFINGLRYKGKPDFDGLYKACRYTLLIHQAEMR